MFKLLKKDLKKGKTCPLIQIDETKDENDQNLTQKAVDGGSTPKAGNLLRAVGEPESVLCKIRNEIEKIHETISTVQSLIPLLRHGGADGYSLICQLQTTNVRMQGLLPLINVFMSEPPPLESEGMEVWKLERENVSREFDTTVSMFRTVQEDLMLAMKQPGPSARSNSIA